MKKIFKPFYYAGNLGRAVLGIILIVAILSLATVFVSGYPGGIVAFLIWDALYLILTYESYANAPAPKL